MSTLAGVNARGERKALALGSFAWHFHGMVRVASGAGALGRDPRERVLVADDEALMRRCISRALHEQGLVTVECSGGYAALEVLQVCQFQLIITDLRMSAGSGIDVLRGAQKLAPGVPVVVVSGEVSAPFAELRSLGAFSVIRKPFKWDELVAVVNRALGRSGEGPVGGKV